MKAEALLALYERVADAPDAMARLRQTVLDLAVRGKLSGQPAEPSDLTAEAESDASPAPGMPAGWRQYRLSALLAEDTRNGYSRRPDDAEDGVPILRIRAGTVRKDGLVAEEEHKLISAIDSATREQYGLRPGDLLACRFNGNKAHVGRLSLFSNYLGLDPIYPDKLIRIRLNPQLAIPAYVRLAGDSDLVRSRVEQECATTVGNWGISASRLKDIDFPVPPLGEQHRIVAKVDELMALLDRLEAARSAREATRDRLTTASLTRLTAPDTDPEALRTHARFALDALPALTTRADQIKQLRQTILDLAVRGELVEQECSNQVQSWIGALSNEGPPAIGDFDPPFSAPPTWTWTSIGAASELVTDGEHSTPARIVARVVPLVTAKNVRDGFMDYSQTDWVAKETAEKAWRRCQPQLNDLLMVCVGATTGRLAVLRESREMVLVRSVALIRPGQSLTSDYLELAIRSPLVQAQIWASVKVSAQPCLYIKRIKALHIPVPSLAEQHRIVAKVDELMALCDRLEAALQSADTTRARLLEALLHKSLAGARAQAQAQAQAT